MDKFFISTSDTVSCISSPYNSLSNSLTRLTASNKFAGRPIRLIRCGSLIDKRNFLKALSSNDFFLPTSCASGSFGILSIILDPSLTSDNNLYPNAVYVSLTLFLMWATSSPIFSSDLLAPKFSSIKFKN